MATKCFDEIKSLVSEVKKDEIYINICKNMKKFRLEKYNEFKLNHNSKELNPYSSQNIAELLDCSFNYYKRYESETDPTKKIPLIKLIKLSIILDKPIEDFYK